MAKKEKCSIDEMIEILNSRHKSFIESEFKESLDILLMNINKKINDYSVVSLKSTKIPQNNLNLKKLSDLNDESLIEGGDKINNNNYRDINSKDPNFRFGSSLVYKIIYLNYSYDAIKRHFYSKYQNQVESINKLKIKSS